MSSRLQLAMVPGCPFLRDPGRRLVCAVYECGFDVFVKGVKPCSEEAIGLMLNNIDACLHYRNAPSKDNSHDG